MSVPPDELQVIMYDGGAPVRIIRGTYDKVVAVVNPIIQSQPVVEAFVMQDTPLANSASLVDPRTPTTATSYKNTYPNREYDEL